MSQDPLKQVTTLSEAAEMWSIDRKTIIWAYWRSNVRMRKACGVWLVDMQSMIDVFGQPKKTLPKFG